MNITIWSGICEKLESTISGTGIYNYCLFLFISKFDM